MINTKICRKCGRELDISCFRIRGEGGVPKRINIDCKECVKKDDKIRRDLRNMHHQFQRYVIVVDNHLYNHIVPNIRNYV